ncbi:MAG: hypothetical protein R2851_23010 [Caldilineaceae bacterium]
MSEVEMSQISGSANTSANPASTTYQNASLSLCLLRRESNGLPCGAIAVLPEPSFVPVCVANACSFELVSISVISFVI